MDDINSPTNNANNQPAAPPSPSPGPIEPNSNPVPGTSPASSPVTSEQKPGVLGASPSQKPKKSKKGLIITLIILLLAAVGAGAWWYMNKDKTEETTTTQETQDIEVLKIGSAEGPASIYFPDEGLTGPQTLLDHQIYEGLVGLENNKPVPYIAQSWTNPDDNTWVFKIRPNVKFHTGKAVTAKEVKAALDSLSQYDYWSLFTSTIASTEATGDLELTIKTKTPDALLLNRLAVAYITDQDAKDKLGRNGTGAYQVDSTATNDEKTTTLVAFDDYYNGHVKTRKLVLTIYESDEASAKALKANEIDINGIVPIPAIKADLEAADFEGVDYDSPGTFGLYINTIREDTILANKEVRKAISQAMDRKTLIDEAGNNNQPVTQVIPKSLPGHDDSITFPAFDLTAAKATLAAAGYKNEQIEFVYVKELQVDAPIILAQLKALGLNIKEISFSADEVDKAVELAQAGDYDLFTAGFTSDISDARDLLGALLSSTESAYPTIKDAAYDKLLADSDAAFDPTERIKILQQANKYVADNFYWVPLRGAVYSTYYDKDIDLKIEFNGTGMPGTYFRKVGRIVE